MKNRTLVPLLTMTLLIAPALRAEEGGTGHYMPGATASFVDAFPGRTGLAVVPTFLYYDGGASASRAIPIIGGTALKLDATVHAFNVPLIYQTPLGLLGGHYAFGAVLPYAWVEATGRLTFANTNLPSGSRRAETTDGRSIR